MKTIRIALIMLLVGLICWFVPPLHFLYDPPNTASSQVEPLFPVVEGYDNAYLKSPNQVVYTYKNTSAAWLRFQEEYVLEQNNWAYDGAFLYQIGNNQSYSICIREIDDVTYLSFAKPTESYMPDPCELP